MRAADKLKAYRFNCKPGEYDNDVYIDLSLTRDAGLSFETVPVVLNILEHYLDLEFEERTIIKNLNSTLPAGGVQKALAELKSLGFIED